MIGVAEDHQALAAALGEWARSLGGPDAVRAAEHDAAAAFDGIWPKVAGQGVPTIAVPEEAAGGGGTLLDAAVALEACARELVPGPLLGTTVVAAVLSRVGHDGPIDRALADIAAGATCGLALEPTLVADGDVLRGTSPMAYDAGGAMHLLLGADAGSDSGGGGGDSGGGDSGAGSGEEWFLVPAAGARVEPRVGVDLTRRAATVSLEAARDTVVPLPGVTADLVRRTTLTLAAAEAAGLASRCLATAVEHAGIREQFGRPIGSFQAVKHLCAGMLETTEAVAAAAWDAASAASGPVEQWAYAVDVAGVVALDGAVQVAQDCIQVLGGIGFTYEHDAHLYLRRAVALRTLLGGRGRHAPALARRAVDGARRRLRVDLSGADDHLRGPVRERVAAIAARPEPERRAALVEAGYLAPHWPAPYGVDATAVEQLVIDEELAAAGVERPDLRIGAWAAPTVLEHGTDAQRGRFIDPTLRGEISWCQLFSEPGAGSDLASLRTRAKRVDGGWRLTGQKVWTSLAAEADWAICLARTGPEESRHRGITYFLVDMSADGIDVRPLREMTGDAMFNEVFLDEVLVPDDCVVGEVDGGWRLARTTLANERVSMASMRLDDSVERAIELAAHAGDNVGEVDLARVGEAVALSTVCALLGARVTLRTLAGQGPGPESSVAKLLGVRSRQDASELVVDLLGPPALLDASSPEVHEMLLTRCLSIAGGTTQVLRNVAAEQILGLPR